MRATETVISRTSPKSLFNAIKDFSEEQKRIITSIGFGGILEIKFNEIPTTLLFHVVDEYTSGNIIITKESIHGILGVPIGGKQIAPSKKRRLRTDSIVERWTKQFKDTSGNPNLVLKQIQEKKDLRDEDAELLFVQNFLVLYATCFVEGNTRGTCNTKFIHNILDIDEVSKLDWCEYSFKCLSMARDMRLNGETKYFHGSASILILHYMDSKFASDGGKGLKWTTKELMTENQKLNNSEEELDEKGVEGEKKPREQKPKEEGIVKSLKSTYAKFVAYKEEVEEKLVLCSQKCPQNETYIAIKEKMQNRDAVSSKEDIIGILLALKNDETWNRDTICVGPFHVRSENAPSAEDARLLEWIFTKDAEGIDGKIAKWIEVLCGHNIYVEKEKMYTLYPKACLSNFIVEFVVEMLCVKELKNENLERWYFPLNSTGELENIQKKRLLCGGVNKKLKSVKQFFFPILKNKHYFLIVVNTPEKKVEVWDTLKGPLSTYKEELNNVVNFLDSSIEPQESFSFYTQNVASIKKQEGFNDCGIYLCYYLEFPDDVHKFQKEEWISEEQRCQLSLRVLKSIHNKAKEYIYKCAESWSKKQDSVPNFPTSLKSWSSEMKNQNTENESPLMKTTDFNGDEKLKQLLYLIRLLLPFVKEIHNEQEKEIDMEASTQGVDIVYAEFDPDERHFCDRCGTSIVDLHRWCELCSVELCLACCWEVREKFSANTSTSQSGFSPDSPIVLPDCNGRLICLGKGRAITMSLRHTFEKNWIRDLEARAETVLKNFNNNFSSTSISSETNHSDLTNCKTRFKSCTKVAVDFVSPENINQCMRLKNEIRKFPETHRAKGDKLEINKLVIHGMNSALTDIQQYVDKPQAFMVYQRSARKTRAGLGPSN